MAITVLPDVVLPSSVILAGVQGKNLRSNTRIQNQGGFETVNAVWALPLRQFTLGILPMLPAQWQALEAVFEVTQGGVYAFLMADPKDNTVLAGAGLLQPLSGGVNIGVAGFGYGVPTCNLIKRYQPAGSALVSDRILKRIKTSAIVRGASPVTMGVAPGNAALSGSLVTFVADTSQALTSIAAGASTVLNFANGTGIVAALAVGGRVYLSGLTGTAAAALNNLSHAITAVGATSLTISTSTTGLAATGGTAYKYPQPSEALAWTGSFYVPVHFVTDEIDWQLEMPGAADTRLVSGPSCVVQEIRE